MVNIKMGRQEAEELIDMLLREEGNCWRDGALESLVFGTGMVKTQGQYDQWLADRYNKGELLVYPGDRVSTVRT